MKLFKAVATALALCAAFAAQARTLDEVKKDGKILIATEGQFAPFNFFNGTTLTGFEVEVAELVAKKMGLTIQWKTLGFDALLTGLRQDRWDLVIASHGITEERAKAVTFTEPHYCSGGMIIAMDPAIKSAKDLAGKIVAVQTGTSYLENVQKVSSIKEMKNFPTDVDARSALNSRREELEVIAPAIAAARAQGLDVHGPFAPDTVFMRARSTPQRAGEFDVVIAMYHDQGLIPVKYLGVDKGVNVTLGLPLVRTSPDHGTAFDIAGQGVADAASLIEAVRMARQLSV